MRIKEEAERCNAEMTAAEIGSDSKGLIKIMKPYPTIRKVKRKALGYREYELKQNKKR